MPIPPEALAQAESALEAFCSEHSSLPGDDQLRYRYQFEASAAVLLEERPGFMRPEEWVSVPRAKFRYSQARDKWSLYWMDANQRWHRVTNIEADKDIRALLRIVITDPLGVFWS
jgi:hypothetical protein